MTSAASEAAESEAASGSTGKLAEQTRVRLVGLEAFVDLNGQLGTLLSFDSSRGRWQVRLDSGQVKNVRVNNLVNIAQTVAPEEKPAKGLKRAAEAPCLKPQATPLRSKSKAAAKAGPELLGALLQLCPRTLSPEESRFLKLPQKLRRKGQRLGLYLLIHAGLNKRVVLQPLSIIHMYIEKYTDLISVVK